MPGCSPGLSGAERAVGVDGAYARSVGLQIPPECFVAADLATPGAPATERFDLAISLEVAEHLPDTRADEFVCELCAMADVVLLSAAIPGQLGTDHITLQPQSLWGARFHSAGYRPFDLVRPVVWNDERVEAFYRQNAIVYVNERRADLIARRRLGNCCSAVAGCRTSRPAGVLGTPRHPPGVDGKGLGLTWHALRRATRRRLRRVPPSSASAG